MKGSNRFFDKKLNPCYDCINALDSLFISQNFSSVISVSLEEFIC